MNVSIGVIVHNEEKNIRGLLDSLINQKTKYVNIRDIIVVSSGSTDKTNKIVSDFSKTNKKIKMIEQRERRGKASAINLFLRESRNNNLVLVSGDIIPNMDVVEKLCSRLDDNVGVVVGRPIPKGGKHVLGGVVELQWRIHHKLSLKKPKLGEMIAFKRIDRVGKTSVDEEFIGAFVEKSGLESVYIPDAVVKNLGPKTIKDFIKQRRRIYSGHLELSRKTGYRPLTVSNLSVLRGLVWSGGAKTDVVVLAFVLESVSRFLGFYDFLFDKKKHIVWDMVRR